MQIIRLFPYIIFLFLINIEMAFPQDNGYILSLKDVLKITKERNQELISLKKRIEAKKAEFYLAYSRLYPTLKLKADSSYIKVIEPQKYETEFTFGDERITSSFKEFSLPYSTSVSLLFSQPLFTGGEIIASIKQAKEDLNKTELQYQLKLQQIIEEIVEGYYNLIKYIEIEKMYKDELNRAKILLNTIQAKLDEGEIPEIDIRRAKLNCHKIEGKIIEVKGEVEIAKDNLKRLLNLPLDSQLEVIDELKYQPIEIKLNKEYLYNLACTNRLEIREAQIELNNKELSVKIAKSQYYPKVFLTGSYIWLGQEEIFHKSWKEFEETQWDVKLNVEVPLFDGGERKSKVKSAESYLEEEEITFEKIKDSITFDIHQAIIRLKIVENRIKLEKQNIDLAKDTLRIIKAKYEAGMIDLKEVFDEENTLGEVSISYINALVEYEITKMKLYKAIGRMDDYEKEKTS